MQAFLRSIVALLMPIILIAAGGILVGWGIDNDWRFVFWAGLGMIGGGVIWGLILWLWVGLNSW